MTSCFEVEEESDERHENSLCEIDKTLAALEAILVRLNWGKIYSLPNEMHQHMVIALKHPVFFSNKVNWAILRENGVLPTHKMTKAPMFGVATSSKGLFQEECNLPMVDRSDGFDLNAYKLKEESGYNFSKPPSPGYVIDAKPYRPNGA